MRRQLVVALGLFALGAGACGGSSGTQADGAAAGSTGSAGHTGGAGTGAAGAAASADGAAGATPDGGALDDGDAGPSPEDDAFTPPDVPPDPVVIAPPPPYKGRIVVTPAALLLTKAGDTGTLHAQAFDANGVAMTTALTFVSSRPAQVTVDAASGAVTAAAALGSSQITVSGGGLTSPPVLVLVAQPPAGAVLVSDAQVIADPAPIDPTADQGPGAEVKVTLDGVGTLAAGTMVLGREGEAVAGRVVSTTPNGTHVDVVMTNVSLFDMFSRLDLDASYAVDAQAVVDAAAAGAAASRASAVPPTGLEVKRSALDSGKFSIGPFECKASVAPNGITINQTLKTEPDVQVTSRFLKTADDDWDEATLSLTGSLKVTGKLSVTIAAMATASLSCKLKGMPIILPIFGPLSKALAPRIILGVRADIKAAAFITSMELGGKASQSVSIAEGLSYTRADGLKTINQLDVTQPRFDPIWSPPTAPLVGVETSVSAGAFATLAISAASLEIVDAFGGAKVKVQGSTRDLQLGDPGFANKYEVYAPVGEITPGSDLAKALKYVGGSFAFKTGISTDGALLGRSPFGTFTADKMGSVDVGQKVTFTVKLDPSALTFFMVPNVTGVHIYRTGPDATPITEVANIGGDGPTFTWTWTPTQTDVGAYFFFAAVDDLVSRSLSKVYVPMEVTADSLIPLYVGYNKTGWVGRVDVTWTGSGTSSTGRGTTTESGSQSVSFKPGDMPSPDGIDFEIQPVLLQLSDDYQVDEPPYFPGASGTDGCRIGGESEFQALGSFTRAGTIQDLTLLQLLPTGDYEIGVPLLTDNVDSIGVYTTLHEGDMCMPDASIVDYGTYLVGSDAVPAMGKVEAGANQIDGEADYMSMDGTRMNHATWHFFQTKTN